MMEVIEALTSAGLIVIVEGENIRVKPKDPGANPDPAKIQPLLEELKAKKQEAITYLSSHAEADKEELRECFDPNGALASLLECAKRKGISDSQLFSIVADLVAAGSLKAPWFIKLRELPGLGTFWLVSDDEAKQLIHTQDVIFSQQEIGLIGQVTEIFGPVKAIEVKKRERLQPK